MLRNRHGFSQEKLATELGCTAMQIHRIENGSSNPSIAMAEAVFQKLGMDSRDVFLHYLSGKDRSAYGALQKLNRLYIEGQHSELNTLVQKLEKNASFRVGIYRQFLLFCKAVSETGLSEAERIERFEDAMQITKTGFLPEEIGTYVLSQREICILGQMAKSYHFLGNHQKAVLISRGLRESMDAFYVDNAEKARTYPGVLYNLSVYLGALNLHEEAQEACISARQYAIRYNNMRILPSLLGAMSYHYWLEGDMYNFREHLIQAYYTARAQGQHRLAAQIEEIARTEHGSCLKDIIGIHSATISSGGSG